MTVRARFFAHLSHSFLGLAAFSSVFSFPGGSFLGVVSSLIHSSLPRKGCLAVTPLLPELPALPRETGGFSSPLWAPCASIFVSLLPGKASLLGVADGEVGNPLGTREKSAPGP